jgi:hypothetical protein
MTPTPEQKKRLISEFRNMLVRTYSNAISAYQGQTLKVLPARGKQDPEDTTVRTQFVRVCWSILRGSILAWTYSGERSRFRFFLRRPHSIDWFTRKERWKPHAGRARARLSSS